MNIIKRLAFICLLTFAMPVWGQTLWENNRHDIRASIGIAPFFSETSDFYTWNTPLGNDKYIENYLGDRTFSPSINLGYSYKFKKWLSVGVLLSYEKVSQDLFVYNTDAVKCRMRGNYLGFTPHVRFDWVNVDMVTIYSSVGIGLLLKMESEKSPDGRINLSKNKISESWDIIMIGMTVGRKLYGFGEISSSSHGLVKFGIGYRFNSKNKK